MDETVENPNIETSTLQTRTIIKDTIIDEEFLNNNKSTFASTVRFINCQFKVATIRDIDITDLSIVRCTFTGEPKLIFENCHKLQIFAISHTNNTVLMLDTPNLISLTVNMCTLLTLIESNTKILQDINVEDGVFLKRIVLPNNHLFKKIEPIEIVGCPEITEIQLKLNNQRITKLLEEGNIDEDSKKAILTYGIIRGKSKRKMRVNLKTKSKRKTTVRRASIRKLL